MQSLKMLQEFLLESLWVIFNRELISNGYKSYFVVSVSRYFGSFGNMVQKGPQSSHGAFLL